MYACCASCRSTTWVEVAAPTGQPRKVACAKCSRKYVFTQARELGNTAAEHYRAIVTLSKAAGIDIHCAYSVLLGLMPLSKAQAIGKNRGQRETTVPAPTPTPTPAASKTSESLADNLDPDYRRAIAEGSLSVQDAMKRGDRKTLVAGLEKRHGLPRHLALGVADNKIPLRRAVQQAARAAQTANDTERPRAQVLPPGAPPSSRSYAVAGIAVVLLALVAGVSWSWNRAHNRAPRATARASPPVAAAQPAVAVTQVRATPEEERTAALARAIDIRTDDEGRIVEIIGPDPRSVLDAYCENFPGVLGAEPLSIHTTEFPEARLGVFREFENGESARSIRIRLDDRSGRWVAGSGRMPIRTSDASGLPTDAATIEVARR